MSWKEVSVKSAREEFVSLAKAAGVGIRDLCRRFEISPTTAYKWLSRAEDEAETFEDRSRRPHNSPKKTAAAKEERILAIRDEHPYWNARKLRRVYEQRYVDEKPPAASTFGRILQRNGRITADARERAHTWQRFEHDAPNELSQIDFKGHFAVGAARCHALTMIDDHSRYAQVLHACTNERTSSVKPVLIDTFRRYGLPFRINADNGKPWGNASGDPHTKLTVWLLRLSVAVSHSRPMHPQTNGKDERFHKTLDDELLSRKQFSSMRQLQRAFDVWRHEYNFDRPHEALALDVPATRYRPSPRPYPEILPPIEYNSGDVVQKIRHNGMLYVWKRDFYIGQAFAGENVAIRPSEVDGIMNVYYCRKKIASIDLND